MSPNELFAAEIQKFRKQAVTEAAQFALDANWAPDVVSAYAFMAGEQWDHDHPHLAGRAKEAS